MGKKSGELFPFDPGILVDDDKRVYLYSGFATKVPAVASRGRNLTNEGGVVLELEQDMVTIKSGPELLFPTKGKKGAFQDHAFLKQVLYEKWMENIVLYIHQNTIMIFAMQWQIHLKVHLLMEVFW